MGVENRTFSDVMQDIVGNVQEIVRSEVRLAKTEVQEEAGKAKSSAVLLGAGALTAIFGILFLLLTIVNALSLVMPRYAATLIVGASLAVIATVMVTAGLRRFRQIYPTSERAVETVKENVEWAKQPAK